MDGETLSRMIVVNLPVKNLDMSTRQR